jgi:4-amino-4-deoxy-L-arabinose transferase-like glycosyltransferase
MPDVEVARVSTDETESRRNAHARSVDGVLIAIVLLAAVVRFWGIGSHNFWYDEWLTTEATKGTLGELLRHVNHREGIPPTYFLIVWGWVHVFGYSELAFRSLGALAGIATVPVAYLAVREFGQRRAVARVTALLVAVNPMLVWYAHDARPYALLALLGAVSLWMVARVRRHGDGRGLGWWAAACAATIAMHYYGIFLVAAEAVALLLVLPEQRRRVLQACLAPALTLLALAPWAREQWSNTTNSQWITNWSLTFRLREAGRSALVGPNPFNSRLWILSALVVLVAAVALTFTPDRETRTVGVISGAVGIAAIAVPLVLTAVGFDIFLARYLIAALVPLIVAVSVGVMAIRAPAASAIIVTCAAALGLSAIIAVERDPLLQKPYWGQVADVLPRDTPAALFLNNHGSLGLPLTHYVKNARTLGNDDPIAVEEIDVLTLKPFNKPCDMLVGSPCGLVFLGAPLPQGIAAQFPDVQRVTLDQFYVDRYRAPAPVTIRKRDLVTTGQLGDALLVAPN